MTGPGLRVRKHHRAGKGSSGLRVLRYSEEEDSLVWDSHKILGAAQHVLPMSDVEVSSVLRCTIALMEWRVLTVGADRENEPGLVTFPAVERFWHTYLSMTDFPVDDGQGEMFLKVWPAVGCRLSLGMLLVASQGFLLIASWHLHVCLFNFYLTKDCTCVYSSYY